MNKLTSSTFLSVYILFAKDKKEIIWVEKLYSKLYHENFKVIFDTRGLKSSNYQDKLSQEILWTDKVIIVFTKLYFERVQIEKSGEHYELLKCKKRMKNSKNFLIGILLSNTWNDVPYYLQDIRYVNFKDECKFEKNLLKLIKLLK